MPIRKYGEYIRGTRKILEESKKENKPYLVTILNKKFIVFPNVFSPKYFRDTKIFAKNLKIKRGDEILEIGSGTGIVSIFIALKGAKKVIAVDINPNAVKNTEENIKRHKLQDKIEVRRSNLYSAVGENEKFNLIFWNTPFGLVKKGKISYLEKAVYDPEYKSTEKFIKGAKKHLKEKGRLFIGFSSTLGRLDLLKKFIDEAGFTSKIVFQTKSKEVYPVKFEIFEAKPK